MHNTMKHNAQHKTNIRDYSQGQTIWSQCRWWHSHNITWKHSALVKVDPLLPFKEFHSMNSQKCFSKIWFSGKKRVSVVILCFTLTYYHHLQCIAIYWCISEMHNQEMENWLLWNWTLHLSTRPRSDSELLVDALFSNKIKRLLQTTVRVSRVRCWMKLLPVVSYVGCSVQCKNCSLPFYKNYASLKNHIKCISFLLF